jgi:hypothetical protein
LADRALIAKAAEKSSLTLLFSGAMAARRDYRMPDAASACGGQCRSLHVFRRRRECANDDNDLYGTALLLDCRSAAPRRIPQHMQLILVLPGLPELRTGITATVRAPALAHLLAMAGAPTRESGGIAAALAARYGVTRQADWPLAPIRLAALGVDPGTAFWLAADPVTLTVGRSDVRLAGVVEDLSRADADALVATLNTHFASDGLTFVAPRPDAFFVRATTRTRLATHAPDAALDRPLHPLLPEGADAGAWRRWQVEIEMLLHEHPVNIERERAGRSPANSVWFSFGGTMPQPPVPAVSTRTFATAGTAAALAAHAGSPARALPGHLGAARADAGVTASIVVVLEPALDVASLERSWAAPARDALAGGALESVTLLADDMGHAVAWHARRPGFWQHFAGRYKRHDIAALLGAAEENG